MAERRYLVMDIETITDLPLARLVLGLSPETSDTDTREQLRLKYTGSIPPPAFHIPVCVALIDVDADSCRVQNAAVLENSDERLLLQQFWKLVRARKGAPVRTTLVHFNGRGFDLPVLMLRSLKHRASAGNAGRM
jgi:hypothetical protein